MPDTVAHSPLLLMMEVSPNSNFLLRWERERLCALDEWDDLLCRVLPAFKKGRNTGKQKKNFTSSMFPSSSESTRKSSSSSARCQQSSESNSQFQALVLQCFPLLRGVSGCPPPPSPLSLSGGSECHHRFSPVDVEDLLTNRVINTIVFRC